MGKRISQLDAAAPVTGTEQIAIVQETRTKRMYLSDLRTYTEQPCVVTLVSRHSASGIGNDANTLEKYLDTYNFPASDYLTAFGDYIYIKAWGDLGNNGDTKTIKLKFGATDVYSQITVSGTGSKKWQLEAIVARMTEITQNGYSFGNLDNSTAQLTMPTEDLSSDIVIALTAESATATANNITRKGLIIEAHKMDTNS